MKSKTIYVKGMHCTACEKLLEDELSHITLIKKIEADRKKEQVKIYWSKTEPSSIAIKEIIKKIGYEVSDAPPQKEASPKKTIDWTQWLSSVLVVLIFLSLLRVFQNSGLIPKIGSASSMNYSISFLTGFAASLSSCLAVVGAVIIAFSEKYRTDDAGVFKSSVKPNLFFHAGRLATFFLLGGLLGLIGGELSISGSFISLYSLFIAVIMFLLALNILGFLPSLSAIGIAMPKKLTGNWERIKNSNHKAAPFALGTLSFFLPCGFTQSMQLVALASGSFLAGASVMFFFALGTVPALLALGVTASWTKNKKLVIFQKAAGILILIFSIYTFFSGLALWGVKANVFSKSDSAQNASLPEKNQIQDASLTQTVEMHVTNSGFSPDTIKVKKGIPVKWIIKGDNLTSCTNKIIVPSLNIQKDLVSGDNIITFTPQKQGTIPFSCWMGMVRGRFLVE